MLLRLPCLHRSPTGLVKMQILTHFSLGWGLGFCIFNKLPDDTDAAGLQTTL